MILSLAYPTYLGIKKLLLLLLLNGSTQNSPVNLKFNPP
jgi:hypothetical protein